MCITDKPKCLPFLFNRYAWFNFICCSWMIIILKGSVRPDELWCRKYAQSIGIGMGPWRWTLENFRDWFLAPIKGISVSTQYNTIIWKMPRIYSRCPRPRMHLWMLIFSKRRKTRFVFNRSAMDPRSLRVNAPTTLSKYACFQRIHLKWLRTRGAFVNVETEGKLPAKLGCQCFK